MKLKVIISILFATFFYMNCSPAEQNKNIATTASAVNESRKAGKVKVGAARIAEYYHLINNKNIALVVNQTSTVGDTHLADTLQQLGITIKTIFAPEHGFRGKADAGEKVVDGIDVKTGIPLLSLYGKNKKPKPAQLAGIEVVIFDIQDVGARFYTYISTMHYVMEACAENGVDVLVLDRPNPNGHYVDGPILNVDYQSFVGKHPIPVVHGMTIAEYAQMVNGEGWLNNGIQCKLTTITCENYNHETIYDLPIKPSPNLPNNRSIYLYPSLCFFEGTNISVGRGTNTQFQVFGHPDLTIGNYEFTPEPMDGAKYPKLEGKTCKGFDLTKMDIANIRKEKKLNLEYLISAYQNYPNKKDFFLKNLFFDKLAGGAELRQQIIAGKNSDEIKATWQKGLNQFKKTRATYLLYTETMKE